MLVLAFSCRVGSIFFGLLEGERVNREVAHGECGQLLGGIFTVRRTQKHRTQLYIQSGTREEIMTRILKLYYENNILNDALKC
jgi:hypothetical protein